MVPFLFDKKPSRRKKSVKKPSLLKSLIYWPFRVLWLLGSRSALLGLVAFGGWTIFDLTNLPEASTLMDSREDGSITLLDRNGKVFAWRGDQFGGIVTADTVSPHLKWAIIATEDKRFYQHYGISPRGIASAVRINLQEGRSALEGHGGSTITQQVAKRVFFEDVRGFYRKILEVPRSLAMEIKYSKDEILAIYLNRAYLGAGSYGFEAASQRYFGKSARDVTPSEAAMLAGLLKAPSRYAPTRNLERARSRANLILGLMQEQGYLSERDTRIAQSNPAELNSVAAQKAGGFFADWIMESAPEFLIKNTKEDLIIRTTFDETIQEKAEEALSFIYETKVNENSKSQAAIVVMSRNGAVRAMVGGRKTGLAGEFNRATQALRQTGSSFKPFVYATALEQGWSGYDVFIDEPITIKIPNQPDYSPKNYSDEFKGAITLTQALAQSINTVAVQVSEMVGRETVIQLANDMGIRQKIHSTPSLALGASESTLLDMTGAYSGFLNLGIARRPYGLEIITIQGEDFPLFEGGENTPYRALSEETALNMTYMLYQTVETGTGRRARIEGHEIAGKTGTTQGSRDAWFIGFNADYIIGVWMGNDDNTPLNDVTGGSLPAEIWHETMARILEDYPSTFLDMQAPIDPNSIAIASSINDAVNNIMNPETATSVVQPQSQSPSQESGIGGMLRRLFGTR